MSDYLKEAAELEKRWANATKNYNPFSDGYNRSAVSTLLENQRLMNENRNPEPELGEFKRLNIPLVRRMYKQLYNRPIQMPIADVIPEPPPTPPKKKKQLRSVDDDWDT